MGRWIVVALILVACGDDGPGPGGEIDAGGDLTDGGPEAVDCPPTQPEVISVSLGFELDDTHFYFASSTALSRAPISDPTAVETVADQGSIQGPIAIGDTHVFFVAGGVAWRVLKAGGVPEMLGPVSGQVTTVATDNTALDYAVLTDTDLELRRAAGGTSTLLALATDDGVSKLASDGTHVYWVPNQRGVVRRVAVTGGEPEVVADSATGVAANISTFGLALAGDDVLWSAIYQSFPDGRLFAIPKQGGSRRTLSQTGLLTGLGVAGDHAYVALTGTSESAIAKVPLDGTARTIIGCVPERVLSVRTNAAGVYVSADNMILRFPL